jgi:hypothetical protein
MYLFFVPSRKRGPGCDQQQMERLLRVTEFEREPGGANGSRSRGCKVPAAFVKRRIGLGWRMH